MFFYYDVKIQQQSEKRVLAVVENIVRKTRAEE